MDTSRGPNLKYLHAESTLSRVKLELFRGLSTDQLKGSLEPGQPGSLKVRGMELFWMVITELAYLLSAGRTSINFHER
jgi:hypothetical protein